MKGKFLSSGNQPFKSSNIYANRSSIILNWLLTLGVQEQVFSLREVARQCGVSVGLVQRVFRELIFRGVLQEIGVRTNKTFAVVRADSLLQSWIDHYSIVNKCRMWTYESSFLSHEEIFRLINKSSLNQKVVLALHSAAEAYDCKNTNLKTLEFYVEDMAITKPQLESVLKLEPKDRGYQVLLIEPYYKSFLGRELIRKHSIRVTSPLLTFLDLYQYPLRGQEQAEFLAERMQELKEIYRRDS